MSLVFRNSVTCISRLDNKFENTSNSILMCKVSQWITSKKGTFISVLLLEKISQGRKYVWGRNNDDPRHVRDEITTVNKQTPDRELFPFCFLIILVTAIFYSFRNVNITYSWDTIKYMYASVYVFCKSCDKLEIPLINYCNIWVKLTIFFSCLHNTFRKS